MCKYSATPLAPLGPAPELGAHTVEVLAEPPHRPAPVATAPSGAKALEGLKVLDLSWVMAGPAASRVLADHGATVVHVESANHVDTARTLQPFRDDGNGLDDSGLFNNMNAGKLGLALDLSKPGSREVFHDLVRWADIVLESFSPRAMRSWGLDYDSLRQVKPDLLMASSCLLGQTGPHAGLAGFGTMAAAVSGFFNVAGWADRAPCGPFGAYTDYVAPKLYLSCLLAAIEHHRVTGEGQYLDFSQAEAALHFLTPALLDEVVNGRTAARAGNDDAVFAPHGVYAALGDEQWVAIACVDDQRWQRLCELIGQPSLAGLDAEGRRAARRDLDELVGAWTATRSVDEVESTLQAMGVAAHRVNDSAACVVDPQLVHRGHFVEVPHATQGTTWVEGSRFVLTSTPGAPERGAPTYGEHVWEVLNGLLGYDADRIADLAVQELLE
ncbi:MAG: CoA transferase [Acidimicrobiia bacterium]|nr:CoA transferase [Acidimicrobiia bacterium]